MAWPGVSLATLDMMIRPGASHARPTKLCAPAKLALERGLGKRRGASPRLHPLLGILQAQKGTVPRALATAGVNQSELMMRVIEVLTVHRSRWLTSALLLPHPPYLAPADTRSAGPPTGGVRSPNAYQCGGDNELRSSGAYRSCRGPGRGPVSPGHTATLRLTATRRRTGGSR